MKMDYDEIATDYAQHRRIHPAVFMSLLKAIPRDVSSSILEVGCGTGNYISAFEETAHCTCFGIDPSKEMLAQARLRNNEVRFELGIAEKLDFLEGLL